MLDARRLQVLTAVVDAGSVTAAAGLLGYTPSAVSQNIAALERDTGTPLFEKAGRGIRPTQAGLLLADHAEAVLARVREAEAAVAALRAGEAGAVRVATFSTAGATLVPRALARFRAAHRGVELDLAVVDESEALARLRGGQIDLAVVAFDDVGPAEPLDDLAVTHLLDDPYRLVVPRNHHLAGRRSIALADLADDAWVATASTRCNARAVVTGACAAVGVEPRFAFEADEFSTALGFVDAGLGVAMLPLLALSSIPEGVRVKRVRGDEPVRHVHAVTRRGADDQPSVRAMLDALRDTALSYVGLVG